jgi:hypothetical protein
MPHHFDKREMLEHRHDVRECLVKRQAIWLRDFEESWMNSIENRVRRLMGDDVVRQTREHDPARIRQLAARFRRGEVPEQQSFLLRRIERIRLPQRMRIHSQLGHKHRPVIFFRHVTPAFPARSALLESVRLRNAEHRPSFSSVLLGLYIYSSSMNASDTNCQQQSTRRRHRK